MHLFLQIGSLDTIERLNKEDERQDPQINREIRHAIKCRKRRSRKEHNAIENGSKTETEPKGSCERSICSLLALNKRCSKAALDNGICDLNQNKKDCHNSKCLRHQNTRKDNLQNERDDPRPALFKERPEK